MITVTSGSTVYAGQGYPSRNICNIVYNLLNNIIDYIYIHFLYLTNNPCVLLFVGYRGSIFMLYNPLLEPIKLL